MKTRNPWLKFYAQDWLGDPKLQSCSIAARGLWVQMICIAHEARPYGHVLVNGEVPSTAQLARMCSVGEDEAGPLISELDLAGVFSRRRDGTIFSRRMVSDEKKAQISRQNGKNGGATKHKKNKEESGVGKVNRTRGSTPDARYQMPEESNPSTIVNMGNTEIPRARETDFDIWWCQYPKKVGRKPCRAKYERIIRSREATVEQILSGTLVYAASRKVAEGYVLNPLTFLNQARWNDEPEPEKTSPMLARLAKFNGG